MTSTAIPTDAIMPRTFAERCRLVRAVHAKLNVSEFARSIGIAPATYATWEDGRLPRDLVAAAQAIHNAYPAVPVGWMVFGDEVQFSSYTDDPNAMQLPFDTSRRAAA